jgi:hypothetical protein
LRRCGRCAEGEGKSARGERGLEHLKPPFRTAG